MSLYKATKNEVSICEKKPNKGHRNGQEIIPWKFSGQRPKRLLLEPAPQKTSVTKRYLTALEHLTHCFTIQHTSPMVTSLRHLTLVQPLSQWFFLKKSERRRLEWWVASIGHWPSRMSCQRRRSWLSKQVRVFWDHNPFIRHHLATSSLLVLPHDPWLSQPPNYYLVGLENRRKTGRPWI